MAAKTFRELRAWQVTRAFKRTLYALIEGGSLARDDRLQNQIREASASAVSHISEGFGRFDPADFARFVKMARASVIECQNHLEDAVDRGHITDEVRLVHDKEAQLALREIGGLLDYLHSPEAKRNAERVKQKRIDRRNRRSNPEP